MYVCMYVCIYVCKEYPKVRVAGLKLGVGMDLRKKFYRPTAKRFGTHHLDSPSPRPSPILGPILGCSSGS